MWKTQHISPHYWLLGTTPISWLLHDRKIGVSRPSDQFISITLMSVILITPPPPSPPFETIEKFRIVYIAHFFVLVVIPLHIPCEYMIVLLSNQMGVSIEIYYTQHCNLLSGICRCTVINDTFEFYEFHHLIELSGNYNVHTINPHNPQALPHKKV